jgi:hypothetical protein
MKGRGQDSPPPEIADTKKLPPLFVCLPIPRSASVKIVAKQQDSNTKIMMKSPIPAVPCVFIAAMEKTAHMPR